MQERRDCFRGELASDRLASEQKLQASVPSLVWEWHLASERLQASARSTAPRAWPAQPRNRLRARWEQQRKCRCQQPWLLQPGLLLRQALLPYQAGFLRQVSRLQLVSRRVSDPSIWLRASTLQTWNPLLHSVLRLPWRRA